MPIVSTIRCRTYDNESVLAAVRDVLAPLGGMSAFVRPGERVLIKPNLLAAKAPEKAVTTHPSIVRAVTLLVIEAGGIPSIGDSPGVGGLSRVAEATGIAAVARETGAELVEFSERVEREGAGRFRKVELARPYLAADRIINLPKLKTHEMMTMTCAVKNLFGAVVGLDKAAWHLKAGADRDLFARLLVEICLLRPPDLNLADAVVGMEGNGPGSGDPREIGVILASPDAFALDVVAARIAGFPENLLWVERAAGEMKVPGADPAAVTVEGPSPEELRVPDFRLPHISDVQFGLPAVIKNRLRHHLTSRPVEKKGECLHCGICRDACPPDAITIENGRLVFDYKKCIRCFCCRELCPHGALDVVDGVLLRLARRWGMRR